MPSGRQVPLKHVAHTDATTDRTLALTLVQRHWCSRCRLRCRSCCRSCPAPSRPARHPRCTFAFRTTSCNPASRALPLLSLSARRLTLRGGLTPDPWSWVRAQRSLMVRSDCLSYEKRKANHSEIHFHFEIHYTYGTQFRKREIQPCGISLTKSAPQKKKNGSGVFLRKYYY